MSLACIDREPVNPLDLDNPDTQGKPYTLQASATGIGKVKLHWRKVNQPEVKSYRIYRSAGEAAPSFLVDATDTLLSDVGLQPNVACSHFYRIVWEDGRELHQSPTASAVTFNAPTGLRVTNVTRNRVEMQWNSLSWLDNCAFCRIYRNPNGTFSLYDSTSSNQYADPRVDAGVTYHYKLMAVATDGSQSNYSAEAYATPGNSAPVIDSLRTSQPFTGWGERVTITCYAHDNDGDPISYSWQALDGGTISGSGKAVTFTVPQDSGFSHRVMATVTDDYSIGGRDTLSIETLQIPNVGLVAYYPFNGNANDESGNGRHGTVNGASLTPDRFGVSNKAYLFDGRSSVTTNFKPSNIFSISLWFTKDPNQVDNAGVLSTYSTSSYNGVYYALNGTTDWIRCDNNSLNSYANSKLNWQHLVIISDGTSVRVYQDNVKRLDFAGMTHHASNIGFGDSRFNGRYLKGKIDDIRIYNRVLTTSEIQALYKERSWTGN